jgi:hypothetical protein
MLNNVQAPDMATISVFSAPYHLFTNLPLSTGVRGKGVIVW